MVSVTNWAFEAQRTMRDMFQNLKIQHFACALCYIVALVRNASISDSGNLSGWNEFNSLELNACNCMIKRSKRPCTSENLFSWCISCVELFMRYLFPKM
jgi:hypothetical protein